MIEGKQWKSIPGHKSSNVQINSLPQVLGGVFWTSSHDPLLWSTFCVSGTHTSEKREKVDKRQACFPRPATLQVAEKATFDEAAKCWSQVDFFATCDVASRPKKQKNQQRRGQSRNALTSCLWCGWHHVDMVTCYRLHQWQLLRHTVSVSGVDRCGAWIAVGRVVKM